MHRFLVALMRAGEVDGLPRHLPPIIVGCFGLILTSAAAAVVMALGADGASRSVRQTLVVRQAAQEALNTLQEVESVQRGYLLTGNDAFLATYQASKATIPGQIGRLQTLISDNPDQRKNVAEVVPLVESRLDLLQQSIDDLSQGRQTQAVNSVRLARGQAIMTSIRREFAEIEEIEQQLLVQRQAWSLRYRDWLLVLLAVSLSAAVALALMGARTIRHYVARLHSTNVALESEIKLRRETEATLRQSQKMEAIGQLAGGIAHDFNNLLTIILGNLDTVRRRLASATNEPAATVAPTLAKPVDLAIQGCRSAAQLTHRLLAFSRRQALEPATLDLNRLVQGMADLLRRTVGEAIEVETVLAGGLWSTFADANQLENALVNLVVNARDAMPDGGRLTIETANSYLDDRYVRQFGDINAGQYVLLSVSDTGGGIPSEVMERVFEPFFTTKEVGKGTGLGLAMVHGFVKQSKGHVRIYSEAGRGTTVKIYLPRQTGDRQRTSPSGNSEPRVTLARAKPSEVILLVEDNDGVREYAATVLLELGYRVIVAGDAAEGLAKFQSEPKIDLLFTDVVLPGHKTGRELAQAILKLKPDLPILFTTGYTRNAIVHNGMLDPNVQLLNKPYTQQELARKIRELLDCLDRKPART